MSSLLRPVGHLPASVYWFRRGLVLAVVVVLIILISNLFGGGGDAQNAAASNPQPNPTTAPPASAPSTTPTAATSSKPTKKPTETPTPKPTKTTPPTDLPCKGTDLNVAALPANRKIVSGSMLNFVVQLTPAGDGCKATTDNLTITVTSGKDLIWSTSQCEKAIQNATLVVAKGKQSAVTVPWDGHRSRPGCLPGQPVAKPGTYVVKAEYAGRQSGAQAFQVV
jgi:cytoskeletal protein RodZ